jgi:hypothetical protein
MKKLVLALSVLALSASLTTLKAQEATPQTASVIVHKDPRLTALEGKQASVNTATRKAASRTMRGYRLLVINTNKRDEAIAAKTKVYTYYPELNAYLSYQTPYFKLKAGNFQTRSEAEAYRKKMTTLFPKGVFIVSDIIEVKGEKEEESD